MLPTEDQALQFAVMLQAGLPPAQAIVYFVSDEEDPRSVADLLRKWQGSKAVKRAMRTLLSKPWHEMSLDERCRAALDQHYSGLAYMLYSTSYIDAGSGEKAKLDTARTAIEAKLAGMAGKTDALSVFYEDLKAGRVKLPQRIPMPSQVLS